MVLGSRKLGLRVLRSILGDAWGAMMAPHIQRGLRERRVQGVGSYKMVEFHLCGILLKMGLG